jgi:hypothetical protein
VYKYRTYQSSLIRYPAIATNQGIARNSLSEHFYPQHVSNYIFSLSVDVRVNQSYVVVGNNAVSKRR